MAVETLSQRILEIYDDLTRAERRLGDLFLEDPDSLVLKSAKAISEQLGVSKATTARFFRRLGYPSFKAAQAAARIAPREEGRAGPTIRALERRGGRGELARHLDNDVQNLVRTIEAIRADELRDAVRMLSTADKLWVVGFGENYPLAHFTRSLLIRIKADIRMVPIGGFPVPEEFASIRATDAMIALGVGRRSRSLRAVMRSAVAAGARVVYVTDQASRGAPDVAHVTLRCRTRGPSVFESVVAPVSVLSHLCAAVALDLGAPAIERLRFIDNIHRDWDDGVGDL
jgi:DNA-binding MurR/RpiR family transcriptional regulator